MTIWCARYTLVPRRRLSSVAGAETREGALLRVGDELGDGFADVHPWPELGDLPLNAQLGLLARGQTTAITRASLELARLDGDARRRGVSLFDGLAIPESHWPGADPPDAFDAAKLKTIDVIPPRVRLRLDFNATLDAETFVRIAETLPRERIDFVEDPCIYDADRWRMLGERTGLRLAFDRAGAPRSSGAFTVLVHKPARGFVLPGFDGELVVTSSMDHPVGQFGAAYVAAKHAERVSARCGLFTHVLYEPDAFVDRVRADGARLLPPKGTGIGFDDLLEAQPWTRLA
jgi:o-succinylbenzoate synthase